MFLRCVVEKKIVSKKRTEFGLFFYIRISGGFLENFQGKHRIPAVPYSRSNMH